MMNMKSPFAGKLILGVTLGLFLLLFLLAWIYFNRIPTQNDLRGLLDRAEAVEIFRFKDDVPVRWVRFEDPERWQGLSDAIRFQETFWRFSRPPEDSVVLQVFIGQARHVWEVRGDGAIHLRKAVRWYKMPVEPEFEEKLRQLLAEFGEDLDPEEQRRRYSPSFTPSN
jgi:hypothetical protein